MEQSGDSAPNRMDSLFAGSKRNTNVLKSYEKINDSLVVYDF